MHNNQNKLATPGNGNLKDVIYHIYGRDIAKNLLECQADTEGIQIEGYIGKPLISRGNRGYENYFINGRYIKSAIISRAIEDAYKTYNMKHKYPFTALMIMVPPETLDVNVHPTKMEVRFSNGELLYRVIFDAVKSSLLRPNLIPNVTLEKQRRTEIPIAPVVPKKKEVPEPFERERRKQIVREAHIGEQSKKEIDRMIPSRPVKQQENPRHVSEEIKKDIKEEIRIQTNQAVKKPEAMMPQPEEEFTASKSVLHETPVYQTKEEKQITFLDEPEVKEAWKPKFKIIGQLFATYWLLELEDKFYIMDQHAAHEKVNYERLMVSLEKKEIYSQRLAPPLILSLSMREAQIIKQYQKAFERLGFVIEEFGGREYCIRAVPANLFGLGQQEVFIELLDSVIEDGVMADMDVISDKLASMACKAAVKGNQNLSRIEVEHLLEELMKCKNPYTCPHGRPTMISMTKTEIEKKFKRIV
jgi:DNA mismatch repair protein MutL